MLPEGIRKASTKNVRMKRKISSAPPRDLTFSQMRWPIGWRGLEAPRAAATAELRFWAGVGPGPALLRFFVDGTRRALSVQRWASREVPSGVRPTLNARRS